jgi:hypothetical protein
MNRAERRRAGNKEKVRTYTLTDVQIKQIKDEAAREAFIEMLAIPVQVLYDKNGWRQIRLDRFTHTCLNYLEMVQDGTVTLAELRKTLKDEAGIEVQPISKKRK